MPSPGGRPARAGKVWTAGAAAARPGPDAGRYLEIAQAGGAAQHDEVVAAAHRHLRLGVEVHVPVGAADADDDDAEALAEPGVEEALAGQPRTGVDVHLLE